MNTNFQMLRELLVEYQPKERGFITGEEMQLIKSKLHLLEMSVLELRNMRDLVVIYLGKSEKMEDWDRMSAITHVIDTTIFNLGGEM